MGVTATDLSAKLHALLIGIDAYPLEKQLFGCVNDVDAVHGVLGRLGVPPAQIRRLTSPHKANGDPPATLANLRRELAALATRVPPGERVFIYYSGHGLALPGPQGRFQREALVPVDVDAERGLRVLYDTEVNAYLARLAAVTPYVVVMLDCCHAAGVPRDSGARSRNLDLERDLRRSAEEVAPPPVAEATRGGESYVGRSVDDCQIIAACLNHEFAFEKAMGGKSHGVLTRAFVQALGERTPEQLAALTWRHIWQHMRDDAERSNAQHLWMSSSSQREVFAGRPVRGDAGFTIAEEHGQFRIGAGTLAGVARDAILAVYGEQPLEFLPHGAPGDAPVGTVRVVDAERASAIAEAETPFALPPSARARLVRLGEVERLRVAVAPRDQRAIATLGALVKLCPASEVPEVELQLIDGSWRLLDDVHRPELPLFTLVDADLSHAPAVFEHYFRYALPLRMANQVANDLPRALDLEVLDARRPVTDDEAHDPDLPLAPSRDAWYYTLSRGAQVCFRVRNASRRRLRVALVNCAATGNVELLGDQIVEAGSVYTFWFNNELRKPFTAWLPDDRRAGIDRLIAFGSTSVDHDLGYLKVDADFDEVVRKARALASVHRGAKPFGARRDLTLTTVGADAPDHWTATQVVIRTGVS